MVRSTGGHAGRLGAGEVVESSTSLSKGIRNNYVPHLVYLEYRRPQSSPPQWHTFSNKAIPTLKMPHLIVPLLCKASSDSVCSVIQGGDVGLVMSSRHIDTHLMDEPSSNEQTPTTLFFSLTLYILPKTKILYVRKKDYLIVTRYIFSKTNHK